MSRFPFLATLLAVVALSLPLELQANVSPHADFETALAYAGSGTADMAASMINEATTDDPLLGPTRTAASVLDADGNVTYAVAEMCYYLAANYLARSCGNFTNGAQVAAAIFAFIYSQAIVIELFFDNGGGGLGLPFVEAENPILTLVFVSAYFELLNAAVLDFGGSDDLNVSVSQNGGNTEVKAEGTFIEAGATAGIVATLQPVLMPFQTIVAGAVDAANDLGSDYKSVQLSTEANAPPNGSISGIKWRDDNGDGFIDEGEPLVPGWTIMMDGPGGPMEVTTDENGEYSFTELEAGQYTLSEGSQTGWQQTFPTAENDGAHVVDLATDEQQEEINFGNQQLGAIKVVKYIDVDGDGVLDETEPFMPDWEITMGETTVLTDENGEVLFDNLPPGNEYSVSEEMREGWANRDDVYQIDNIEVLPGETTVVEFGNFRYGEIIITKYEDKNGNGQRDDPVEEGPVQGVEFTVGESTMATDENGLATFEMLKPGTITVTEAESEMWKPVSGSLTTEVELIHGETEELEIGNYKPGKITVTKYEDLNGDGDRDNGEPALQGWEITVGEEMKETDGSGQAMFDNLKPGSYSVSEALMDGWKASDGPSENVMLMSGEEKEVDFGNYRPAKITVEKYSDDNRNGALDLGDAPVANWEITCSGPSCTPPDAKRTDNNGMVMFSDLDPGMYTITEETRAGWTVRVPVGASYNQTLESGEMITLQFLNEPPDVPDPGSIHAQKFLDSNGDGVFDPGEVGLNGVTIRLNGGAQTQVTHDMDLNSDGTIDPHTERGWVWFVNLPAGNYTLDEVVPTGMTITTPVGNLINIALAAGEVNDQSKFGNIPAGDGLDLGDAPEDEADPPRPEFPFGYPTTVANNGASHSINDEFHLGDRIDGELDGQPSLAADGDDVEPTVESDDEDGVRFASDFISLQLALDPGSDDETTLPGIIRGTDATIEVSTSAAGFLNGWVDWNRDGDWDDEGEQMFENEPLSTGDTELDWAAPQDAGIGFTYARFRFTPAQSDVGYDGYDGVGEVEDYLMLTLGMRELDSTGDTPDANPGDGICADASGMCTLRAAIMETNAGNIPYVVNGEALGKSGVATLTPQSPFPPITGTLLMTGNGTLNIDGTQAGADAHGLVFLSPGNLITATTLYGFDGDGIRIESNGNDVFDMEIRDNGGAGVNVVSGTGNFIRTSSIEGNAGLGIDLGDDGVTNNDAGDADSGANGLQNHPVLSGASAEGAIQGSLDSTPNTEFVIDFFASPACDPSGSGEGMRYIGSASASTDGSGNASFDGDFPDANLTISESVTATATSEADGTSEFSTCFAVMDTSIERREDGELPNGYNLEQNYPNPFNPVTTFSFTVPQSEFVSIDVFDLLGKHVANVVSRQVSAGEYSVQFDASALPSGTYVYRMTAGAFSRTRQFTLLK